MSLFLLQLPVSAEEGKPSTNEEEYVPVFKKAPFKIASCMISPRTTDGVAELEGLLKKKYSMSKSDLCHQITPAVIKEKSDYRIFKYDESCASLLLYKQKVYQLGEYFGGRGVVDAKLADLNQDGKDELYFTFSWGSGLHRAQAGYFDPVHEKIVIFPYAFRDDIMFDFNFDKKFYVYGRSFDGKVRLSLVNGTTIFVAEIFYMNGKIDLKPFDDKYLMK